MPLHEYLEQKRRQNIDQLNQSGACHICGSNKRNTEGFHHAVNVGEQQGGNYNENSMVRPPNISAMRTCACFGNTSPDSDDYWPYSVSLIAMTKFVHILCTKLNSLQLVHHTNHNLLISCI